MMMIISLGSLAQGKSKAPIGNGAKQLVVPLIRPTRETL